MAGAGSDIIGWSLLGGQVALFRTVRRAQRSRPVSFCTQALTTRRLWPPTNSPSLRSLKYRALSARAQDPRYRCIRDVPAAHACLPVKWVMKGSPMPSPCA